MHQYQSVYMHAKLCCKYMCVGLPFQQLLAVDVAETLEEGEGVECVGVTDSHEACHRLNQTHEALQLRYYVL